MLCTSGTAAANFHPAVIEAHHGRVPLHRGTADRPPELRDAGAGQTIDQTNLYGDAVRWFLDLGVPADVDGAGAVWRSTAARTVAVGSARRPGPVHWNLPFREPLVPTGAPLVDAPGPRRTARPWTASEPPRRDRFAGAGSPCGGRLPRSGAPRGRSSCWVPGAATSAVALERFVEVSAWPVLADPFSGLRRGPAASRPTTRCFAATASRERTGPTSCCGSARRPRAGAGTASSSAACRQIVVTPDDAWLDPGRDVVERIVADPDAVPDRVLGVSRLARRRGEHAWFDAWCDAERMRAPRSTRTSTPTTSRSKVAFARDVVDAVPDGGTLVVASSMPVRDVESFARPRDGVRVRRQPRRQRHRRLRVHRDRRRARRATRR